MENQTVPPDAELKRIKNRYRYELRDPALPHTTVDEMTALLDSHDEQAGEIESLRRHHNQHCACGHVL